MHDKTAQNLQILFNFFQLKRELEQRMEREYEDYINGTQKSIYLMDLEIQRKQRYCCC